MANIQVAVINKKSLPARTTQLFTGDSFDDSRAQAQSRQNLTSLGETESPKQLLCLYVNVTNKVQIARITNIENWYFERVVFPGQRLFFEALPQAQLEIHTGMIATAILSDKIPCSRLCISL